MVTSSPGLPPLSTPPPPVYLLGPREWALVEALERRAAAASRMSERAAASPGREVAARVLANDAKTWRQAAQLVREHLSRVDIDLTSPTVLAQLQSGPGEFVVSTRSKL